MLAFVMFSSSDILLSLLFIIINYSPGFLSHYSLLNLSPPVKVVNLLFLDKNVFTSKPIYFFISSFLVIQMACNLF